MKSHADKHQDSQSKAAANHSASNKHSAGARGILDGHRPESLQLERLQLMADSSPQAEAIAQLQAIAGGKDGLPAGNRPESLQLRRMQLMADSSPQAEGVAQLMPGPQDAPIRRMVGTPVGWLFRGGINWVTNYFGGINRRWHAYATPDIRLARVGDRFNADLALGLLDEAPVGMTVPGAFMGGGILFGPRENNGMAAAFLGGPVITTTDYANNILINTIDRGHIFGGVIRQFIWVQNGFVYTRVEGTGVGNFAYINERVGAVLFTIMIARQRRYINEILRRLPPNN